jgi:hypothetical protein
VELSLLDSLFIFLLACEHFEFDKSNLRSTGQRLAFRDFQIVTCLLFDRLSFDERQLGINEVRA